MLKVKERTFKKPVAINNKKKIAQYMVNLLTTTHWSGKKEKYSEFRITYTL